MANLFRCGGGKKLKEQTYKKTGKFSGEGTASFELSKSVFTELNEIIGVKNISISVVSFDGFTSALKSSLYMKLLDDYSFVSVNEDTISFKIEYIESEPVTIEVSVTAIGY